MFTLVSFLQFPPNHHYHSKHRSHPRPILVTDNVRVGMGGGGGGGGGCPSPSVTHRGD